MRQGLRASASPRPKLVGRAAVAKHFGVHPQTVSEWTADGCPVAARGRGAGHGHRYDVAAIRAWRRAVEKARRDAGTLSLDAERAALAKVQRERVEIQNAARRGELLEVERVRSIVGELFAAIRGNLLAIPASTAESIAGAARDGGPRAVERALREAITGALRELSTWRPPWYPHSQEKRA